MRDIIIMYVHALGGIKCLHMHQEGYSVCTCPIRDIMFVHALGDNLCTCPMKDMFAHAL